MKNRILTDYLDDFARRLRHLPDDQRKQVLSEVRAHLEDDLAQRRAEDTGLSLDEATLQATEAFGEPTDLSVAYGASGGVVRTSTGQVVLRIAAATARGVGSVLKWILIAFLVLLGLAVVVGVAVLFVAGGVLEAYEDEIAGSVPRPIYDYQGSWVLPDAQTRSLNGAFQVSTDATGFDLDIDVRPATGCLAIQVVAPDGAIAYSNNQGCEATRQHLHFSQQGSWRIQYTFAAFTGSVDVEAYEYRPGTPG
jgi:hypothetical protein